MNPLATTTNRTIQQHHPYLLDMMSEMGRALFFPKGILSQSAEARQKAHHINATIGIAREDGHVMGLDALTEQLEGLSPETYLPYAPSFGIVSLREKWKQALYQKNPSLVGKAVSLPVVTSGITHGVSTFADLWIDSGDTVILPDMMWGNYTMTFQVRRQARLVTYPTFNRRLTGLDMDAFEKTVTTESEGRKKIVIVLNFPNNPSGYTPTPAEARQIVGVLTRIAEGGTHVVAMCDDAYFGLFFDNNVLKESIFALLAGAHPRIAAVKLDGATKEDYVWGLRTGFVTYGFTFDTDADAEAVYTALEQKTAGCIRGCISNVSHLGQTLVTNAMDSPRYSTQKREKEQTLKERALTIKDLVYAPAYRTAWDVYPFNSGYFMCLRLKDVDAESLRIHLLDAYGVGLIAIGERNIRVAFSCIEAGQAKDLFDTIFRGIEDLSNGTS